MKFETVRIYFISEFSVCSSLRSKRFRASFEKVGKKNAQKKKMNDGGGGGKRRKRLPANPTILIGAVRVVLITEHSKHQSNQVCFVYVHQIWSHLIYGRRLLMAWTDIYLNRVRAKVYQIRVFRGDRAVETREGQFIENDGVRI